MSSVAQGSELMRLAIKFDAHKVLHDVDLFFEVTIPKLLLPRNYGSTATTASGMVVVRPQCANQPLIIHTSALLLSGQSGQAL